MRDHANKDYLKPVPSAWANLLLIAYTAAAFFLLMNMEF